MSEDRGSEVDRRHDSRNPDPMHGWGPRRRLAAVVAATATAGLVTTGILLAGGEAQDVIRDHKIAPTTLEVGKLTLKDDAELFINDPVTGGTTQIPWDEVTLRGIPLKKYKDVGVTNALIREIPEPGNPYYADVILKDAHLADGKTTDLRVAYDDPNLGHSLVKGFADVSSLHTTPDGGYTATYLGKPIPPSEVFIVTPGQPKE
jgi:hypothetical protein